MPCNLAANDKMRAPAYRDIAAFQAELPAGHSAFASVYAGAVDIGDAASPTRVEVERMAGLGSETGTSGARLPALAT